MQTAASGVAILESVQPDRIAVLAARRARFLADLQELSSLVNNWHDVARWLGLQEKQPRDWLAGRHEVSQNSLDRYSPRLEAALAAVKKGRTENQATAPSPVTSPVLPATDSRDDTTTRPTPQKEQEALVAAFTLHPLVLMAISIAKQSPEGADHLTTTLEDAWTEFRHGRSLHLRRDNHGFP